LGGPKFKDAVVENGLGLAGIHLNWQGKRALELSMPDLVEVRLALLILVRMLEFNHFVAVITMISLT
jgi:hypothetical protein